MSHRHYVGAALVLLGLMLPVWVAAQADSDVSLGDLARSLRKTKASEAATIVDNDNLTEVIDDVESYRLNGKRVFSFDGAGKQFQVSSPDGTCSLAFNANATALLSNPFVPEILPPDELTKVDGPASIHDDVLEVSVYNQSLWSLREITVGLTLVRSADSNELYGTAKLLPASAEDPLPAERRSDLTVLLHLKGTAIPFATAVFREKLDAALNAGSPGQEWHWAIVEAKGIPPSPASADAKD